MIFTEFRFFIFFIIAFIVYWQLNKNQYRKFWLLACSYFFYGVWDWRFLSLIFISTVVDYISGGKIFQYQNPQTKKKWLLISLFTNLGLLGFFKYFNFFTDSAIQFFPFLGFSVNFSLLNIILPVGISFYTFQTLSYSLDIYKGKLKATKSFLDFALFVCFFPQLVAGPIVRASIFLPQLLSKKQFSQVDIRGCLILFLVGFFKKACIGDNLSPIISEYFSNPEIYTWQSSWVAVISFSIQLYCDFSGYSDMAIACAGLLGYKLPLNFNFPYFTSNITQLWRHWHITMSGWFKDYLYIPLMKRRKKQEATKIFSYRNLFITMCFSGLWHGAAWNFVVWGGLHGIALIVHKEWSRLLSPYKKTLPIREIIGIPLTFYWFCVSVIFFRCQDIGSGLSIVKSFVLFQSLGNDNLGLSSEFIYIFAFLVLLHWLEYQQYLTNLWRKISTTNFVILYTICIGIILPLIAPSYEAFIYFQF